MKKIRSKKEFVQGIEVSETVYNRAGKITDYLHKDGEYTEYTYNNAMKVSKINHVHKDVLVKVDKYTYDDIGNNISIHSHFIKENRVDTTIMGYNVHNNILYKRVSKNSTKTKETHYTYDEKNVSRFITLDNDVILTHNYDNNGRLIHVTGDDGVCKWFEFDTLGNIINVEKFTDYDTLTERISYIRDQNGKCIETNYYTNSNNITGNYMYTYTEDGHISSLRINNMDGSNNTIEYEYEYYED